MAELSKPFSLKFSNIYNEENILQVKFINSYCIVQFIDRGNIDSFYA